MIEFKDWITISLSLAAIALAGFNFLHAKQVEKTQFLIQFTQDVYQWTFQVLEIFSEIYSTGRSSEFKDRKKSFIIIQSKISTLWDSGRLLFPNHIKSGYGNSKEGSFRGIRPEVLDNLNNLYKSLETEIAKSEDYNYEFNEQNYILIQRHFISSVQTVVATRLRFDLVRKFLKSEFRDAGMSEDKELARRL